MMHARLFLMGLGWILSTSSGWAQTESSTTIARYALRLGKIMEGTSTSRVYGDTADQQLRDYALRVKRTDAAEVKFKSFFRALPNEEQVTPVYGWTTASLAAELLIRHAENLLDENGDQRPVDQKEIRGLLQGLRRSGAKLAYVSEGTRVCGMEFPGILILDVKAKKMFEIGLVFPEC